jgi:DNA-binding CsgD family transcriptional regulator
MGKRFARPNGKELEREHILLSNREEEVAEMYFGRNMTAEDIAEQLGIGETTVYNYKNRAEEKIERQSKHLIQMVRNQARIGNSEKLSTVAQEAEALSLENGLGSFNQTNR